MARAGYGRTAIASPPTTPPADRGLRSRMGSMDHDRGAGRGLPARLRRRAIACQCLGADRTRAVGPGNAWLGRTAASVDRRCWRQRQWQEPRCRLPDARRAARDREQDARRLPRPLTGMARRGRVRDGRKRAMAKGRSRGTEARQPGAPSPEHDGRSRAEAARVAAARCHDREDGKLAGHGGAQRTVDRP